MEVLVRNGIIVSDHDRYQADILIRNGVVVEIGLDLSEQIKTDSDNILVINADGKYVIPGGVDVHTHMDLQAGACRAVDDFYDGTVAAACGGTTSIVDHMAFGPAGCSLHHQLEEYHRLADKKAVIDYGFHGVSQHPFTEDHLKELKLMLEDGVPSLKVYMTYDTKLEDDEILMVLREMKKLHGVTAFHCENHMVTEHNRKQFPLEGKTSPIWHAKSRPNLVEAEAVRRVLYLAALAEDAPVYIVHLSCRESLQAVEEARRLGQKNIFVETCPQYLTLTEECYERKDGLKYVMSPPLRTKQDIEYLWKGLKEGKIQTVATDHCPFNYKKEKQLGRDDFTKCPNGIPGVEERMSLLLSEGVSKGRITMEQLVAVACTNPAKIYGLYPQKGVLRPGSDGDLVIIDPEKEYVLTHRNMHSAVDYTAYEGMKVKGKIELVMQRGNILMQDGRFTGQKGKGKFIFRHPLK